MGVCGMDRSGKAYELMRGVLNMVMKGRFSKNQGISCLEHKLNFRKF
jgi:hypothetical protein